MYQRIIFAHSLMLLTSLVHGAANNAVTNIEQLPAWIAAKMEQCQTATSPQGDTYRLSRADHDAEDFALLGRMVDICADDRLAIFADTRRQEWVFEGALVTSVDKKEEEITFTAQSERLLDQKLYGKILADVSAGWTISNLTLCRPAVKKSENEYYFFFKRFPTYRSSFKPVELFSLLAQRLGIDNAHYLMNNVWGKGFEVTFSDNHYLWIKKEAIKDMAAKLHMSFENFKLEESGQ